jgi:hypothetical protein
MTNRKYAPECHCAVHMEEIGGQHRRDQRRGGRVRPMTAAEKKFCALGLVAEAFITGAAAAAAPAFPPS